MAPHSTRVSKYRERFEPREKRGLNDSQIEEKREKERRDRWEEIQNALVNIDRPSSTNHTNNVPSYTRRPAAQPSPPLSPIEQSGFQNAKQNWRSDSDLSINAPPSPESLRVTESPSFFHGRNGQAIHHLQTQLDDVKVKLERMKQESDNSKRQIETLTDRLNEATRRADDAVQESDDMRREISRLRITLREAREEERKLNDEINLMRAREDRLMKQISDARAPHQDTSSSQAARSPSSGDDRNKKTRHGRKASTTKVKASSRKGSASTKAKLSDEEMEMIQVRPVRRGARPSWRLP
jgi:hypothetical protein